MPGLYAGLSRWVENNVENESDGGVRRMKYEDKPYVRRNKRIAEEMSSMSAITDHVRTENHIVDWDGAKIRQMDKIFNKD